MKLELYRFFCFSNYLLLVKIANNMKKTNKISLNEAQLRNLIAESIKKVLKEEIVSEPGKYISAYYNDYVPYDDDYIERYGNGGVYDSDNGDNDKINRSIPNEVYGLAQRVENLAKRINLYEPEIKISADRTDTERERSSGGWSEEWTETSFDGIMTIRFSSMSIDEKAKYDKFLSMLYRIFNYYCENVRINSNKFYGSYEINVKFSCPYKDGRNNKFESPKEKHSAWE